jgi:beta-glucosidase
LEAAQRVDVLTNLFFVEPLLGLGYPWQELKVLQGIERYMKEEDENLLQSNKGLCVQMYDSGLFRW